MERTEQTDRARKMKKQRRIECVQIERLEFFFTFFHRLDYGDRMSQPKRYLFANDTIR